MNEDVFTGSPVYDPTDEDRLWDVERSKWSSAPTLPASFPGSGSDWLS